VLIPPWKIVIIMLPTTHSTVTEAVEGKDKHPFFVRNSSSSVRSSYLISYIILMLHVVQKTLAEFENPVFTDY